MANENVNLNDLAQNLCMSLKQVNRKVISITGDSLSKYVMQIRMHRAKQLLDSDNNYTIAEVGQRCGFNENSNFTRTFKTFYDITPSQYRRMPRNNENKTENQNFNIQLIVGIYADDGRLIDSRLSTLPLPAGASHATGNVDIPVNDNVTQARFFALTNMQPIMNYITID